jgi:hypothetical protein
MAQDAVGRHGGTMTARGRDQLPRSQPDQCGLHGAFGKARFIRDHAQTCPDRPPALTRGAAIKKQKYEKRSRLLIVPDQVPH